MGTLPLGTSSDLMVGETVIAIGNAFGYEHTVSVGIISHLHRDVTLNREVSYRALIQTDASINPGNSGGPLLNIDGELIGMNVAIRAGAQGISFALPIDQVLQGVSELLANDGSKKCSWDSLTRMSSTFAAILCTCAAWPACRKSPWRPAPGCKVATRLCKSRIGQSGVEWTWNRHCANGSHMNGSA